MFSMLCILPPSNGDTNGGEVHRATLEYTGHGAGFCAVAIAEESSSSTEQALRQPRDSQNRSLNL